MRTNNVSGLSDQNNNIPSQFISIDAYEAWRDTLMEEIDRVRNNFYPSAGGLNDFEPPPAFSIINPASWIRRIQYFAISFAPPVLIESDSQRLEYRLTLINKYLDLAQRNVRHYMLADRGLIFQTLALIDQAKEKLKEKFPGYPLEYSEIPKKDNSGQVFLFLFYISMIFPSFLVSLDTIANLRLSFYFNFIPQYLLPFIAKMTAVSLKPDQTLTFLSYSFYTIFVVAILRYRNPLPKMLYNPKKYRKTFYCNLAIFLCIGATPILSPDFVLIFFKKAPYFSPFILFPAMLWSVCGGELFGVITYKVKNRFD